MDTGTEPSRQLAWAFLPEPAAPSFTERARALVIGGGQTLEQRLARASAAVLWETLTAEGVTAAEVLAVPPELVVSRIRTARGGCLRWAQLLQLDPMLTTEKLEGTAWGELRRWMKELMAFPRRQPPVKPDPRPAARPPAENPTVVRAKGIRL
jgi:hypothetical protein